MLYKNTPYTTNSLTLKEIIKIVMEPKILSNWHNKFCVLNRKENRWKEVKEQRDKQKVYRNSLYLVEELKVQH